MFELTLESTKAFIGNLKCSVCETQTDQLNNIGNDCKHVFCWECVNRLQSTDMPQCPTCMLPLGNTVEQNKLYSNLYEHLTGLQQAIQNFVVDMERQDVYADDQHLEQTQAILRAFDEPPRRTVAQFCETQRMYPDEDDMRIIKEERDDSGYSLPLTQLFDENRPSPASSNEYSDELLGGDDEVRRGRQASLSVSPSKGVQFMDTQEVHIPRSDFVLPDSISGIGGPIGTSTQRFTDLFQSQLFTQHIPEIPDSPAPVFKMPTGTSQFRAKRRSSVSSDRASPARIHSPSPLEDKVVSPAANRVMRRATRSSSKTPTPNEVSAPASPMLFASQQFTQVPQEEEPLRFGAITGISYFTKKPERSRTFGNSKNEPEWPLKCKSPRQSSRRSKESKEEEEINERDFDITPKRVTRIDTSRDKSSAKDRRPSTGVLRPGEYNVVNAVLKGDANKLARVLEQGVNVNERDIDGLTPIYHAAMRNRVDMCEMLIEAGALVNAHCGRHCNTPLHAAVLSGRGDAMEYLLSRGSNKYARNIHRQTPMDLIKIASSPLRAVLKLHKPVPLQPVYPFREWRVCIPSSQEIEHFRADALRIFSGSVTEDIDDRTTHLVLGGVSRDGTVDFSKILIEGMSRGLFIVSSSWLDACITSGTIQEESPYELQRIKHHGAINEKTEGKCKELRKAKSLLKPGLFFGAQFYFEAHRYNGYDRQWLRNLVLGAEGKVITREPLDSQDDPVAFHDKEDRRPYFLVYCPSDVINKRSAHPTKEHITLISPTWIEECIMTGTLMAHTF